MHTIRQYVAGFAAVLLLAGNATAVTWLDFQGSGGADFSGWSSSAFDLYLATSVDSLTQGATLGITADTGIGGVDGALFTTAAFAASMNDYSGGDTLGMSFDLTGDTPSGLGFYFQAQEDGEGEISHWFYEIPTMAVAGPGRYNVQFDVGAGWFGLSDTTDWGGTVATMTFATAIQNVTQHGFFVVFNPEAQSYGLNDFGLTVPEPETYMILGMALLSMAMVFRKRITDSLVEARAMLQV